MLYRHYEVELIIQAKVFSILNRMSENKNVLEILRMDLDQLSREK